MSDDLKTSAERDSSREGVPQRGRGGEDGGSLVSSAAVTSGAVAIEGGAEVGSAASLWSDAWGELRRSPTFLIPVLLIAVLTVMAIAPGLFTNADPNACSLTRARIQPGQQGFVFGTDVQGCDYYARTIYGARISMIVGVTVAAAATAIAIFFGSLAGYYGRLTDTIITRITDIWFAIPTILGGIIILSVFQTRGVLVVALVLILLAWPTMLRLMRSSVLSVREQDYVQAARALGASNGRIIRRHILPNAIAPVIVYGTITVGIAIVAEASLSFLGIGLQLPEISWGLMINVAQTRVRNEPYLLFFPAAFLSVTVFSFILLGDALRDALDPKSR